jgi:serine/threonine protein kinase/Flp pilus assembly protein TadD
MGSDDSDRDPIEELAEEFVERYRRGERPALAEYTDRYPQWADKIRALFPALVVMEKVRPEPGDSQGLSSWGPVAPRLERLGDYRILREVGRGGMGVVYEAEQESLGRHVALKVLAAQAVLDPGRLERFRREARAAARLHHTNIVPVHGVGEENGLHYYVMQFIQGQGLDQVLAEVRRLRRQHHKVEVNPTPATEVAQALLSGQFGLPGAAGGPSSGSGTAVHLPGQAEGSTLSESGWQYWHSIARIGIQVADAISHAVSQGILHRDIKPSNLLLDTRGCVWVTDFGLAKADSDPDNVTHSGDVVGTLRYLAPERFAGQADVRSDVYALGLTLYELLTLRPAFEASDRHQLIAQVMHEQPPRPRLVDRAIPRDLETIVLKAIARYPGQRYQTPAELAEDLQRFLDDRPIKARRQSLVQHTWRWCRRKPAAAALVAALAVLFAGAVGAGFWYVQDRAQQATERLEKVARLESGVTAALDEVRAFCKSGRLSEALANLKRAEDLLAGGEGSEALRQDVAKLRAEVEMAARLEGVRLERGVAVNKVAFDYAGSDRAYRDALDKHGLDVAGLDPEQAARRIQTSAIKGQLLAALDDWLLVKGEGDPPGSERLRAVLRRADPDSWRNQLRAAFRRRDKKELAELARTKKVLVQPTATVLLLGEALDRIGEYALAIEVLQSALREHPGDFWIHHNLGVYLMQTQPVRLSEAVASYRAALALRPDSPGVHLNLGLALRDQGDLAGALAACRKAIALNPDYPVAHNNLGLVLQEKGDLSGAQGACRKAIALKPDYVWAHNNLGVVLHDRGDLAGALEAFQKALDLEPRFAWAHLNRGAVLRDRGDLAGAIAAFRQALACRPGLAGAYYNLGVALRVRGDLVGATAAFRQAVAHKPDYATAHYNLGNALSAGSDPGGAITAYQKAIALKPNLAEAHCNLGHVLCQQGDFRTALAALRRGHELGLKQPNWPYPSAAWVRQCRRLVELEEQLPVFLQGDIRAASAGVSLELAQLCSTKRLNRAAVRFYEQAITAHAKPAASPTSSQRYDAACAAVQAGCGLGKDAGTLDAKERTRLRGVALGWLKAELALCSGQLRRGTAQARAEVRRALGVWHGERDLAVVRDAAGLARLPAVERRAWQQFWSDVEALRQQADTRP